MSRRAARAGAVALLAVSFVVLYGEVLSTLVRDWANDGNYSHGFLIIPIAAYLAWERRTTLRHLPMRPSGWGLFVVAASFGVLLIGSLGAELFLTRMALLGTLAGSVLFVLGAGHLKALAFPIAFLLLMIPLPSILFNQIAFPLQLVASRLGVVPLVAAGIPVLREGNVIVLPHTTLEVAEACSGIRSLVSLLTVGIVYGYFIDPRGGIRLAVALATIPVAILANGARVAGTGIAAHYYGAAAAEGFFHTFSGIFVFVTAFLMLSFAGWLLRRMIPSRSADPQRPLTEEARC
jgi:exosortase